MWVVLHTDLWNLAKNYSYLDDTNDRLIETLKVILSHENFDLLVINYYFSYLSNGLLAILIEYEYIVKCFSGRTAIVEL